MFEELRSLLVGNDVHGVPVPPWLAGSFALGDLMSYPWYRLFASAACIVARARLYFVVNRTRLGMMIRAGASNRDMVRGLGIDIRLLYRIVFAGRRRARGAGRHDRRADVVGVSRAWARSVLIICFVVVVIGGIGSITGALVASLLVGFVDTFGKVFFAEWSGVGVYVLMAIILIWRPEGLMKRGAERRRSTTTAPPSRRAARHRRREPAAGSCRRRVVLLAALPPLSRPTRRTSSSRS